MRVGEQSGYPPLLDARQSAAFQTNWPRVAVAAYDRRGLLLPRRPAGVRRAAPERHDRGCSRYRHHRCARRPLGVARHPGAAPTADLLCRVRLVGSAYRWSSKFHACDARRSRLGSSDAAVRRHFHLIRPDVPQPSRPTRWLDRSSDRIHFNTGHPVPVPVRTGFPCALGRRRRVLGALGSDSALWARLRPLDLTSPGRLARSYRSNAFTRIGLAEAAVLTGLVGVFVGDSLWIYVVGMAFGLFGLSLAAPSVRDIQRRQQEIAARGSALSLVEVLAAPKRATGESGRAPRTS